MLLQVITLFFLTLTGDCYRTALTVTYITALYDIGLGATSSSYGRSYADQLVNFEKLLQTPSNLIIYGPPTLREFVREKRKADNTVFVERELGWFERLPFAKLVERNRQSFRRDAAFWQKHQA